MASLTLGAVLRRAALAGLFAGVAAALIAFLVVEPRIDDALAIEAARSTSDEEPLFGRTTQVFGGMVAAAAVAVCLALVVGVVFARVRHRLPATTDFGRAALLAFLGFTTVALLPALKYPANPPGVGDPDTVTERTVQYLTLIAAAAAVTWLAFLVHDRLSARPWPPAYRAAVGVAVAAVGYTALLMTWPASPDSVPADIPAALLWDFRLASLAELATLWTVFGLGFGLLLTPRPVPAAAVA
ncbi:CbtA family protein [Phytohabitans sp. ZYX-F-186]|uniref:CbtA family protein n=1 Tax=Phytohabitans maris TaxID=3071409 RepID=A0ABU0ZRQ4_9ACTN|nr:CbtA family protein [Phytohabitans sp. ZYX-F-186]MDQ7909687.1 CbtA family protein [Phytohabitans sp. ZYX-F-186]